MSTMASHLAGGRVNVAQVQELARKQLVQLLEKCQGRKVIVWDESLAGPVGLIATYSLLKEHDVPEMFPLRAGKLPSTTQKDIKNIIFITRPHLHLMDKVADNVYGEEHSGGDRKEFHLFFVPQKSLLCEKWLKNRGVFGNFTWIEEFPCDLFPFDNDLMSMELESAFKEYQVEHDPTVLYRCARALMTLQQLFGPIPRVSAKGTAACQVWDTLLRLRREQMPSASRLRRQQQHASSQIDHLLLIDRSIDLLSPLATQLTYEGLIDEIFGITNCTVQLPAEKFAKPDDGPGLVGEKKNIILNSAEELFAEIRDKNFNAVGPALSRRAKQISSQLEECQSDRSVQEMKRFVARLPHMLASKTSLANHTTIAELIKEVTDSDSFLECLQTEQEFMNGIDTDKVHPYIEDCIAQQEPLIKVLRLLCMQSVTNSGLRQKVLEHYKRDILQTYGFQHILTLSNLEQAGLLRVQQGPRQYAVLRKTLQLTVDNGSETSPTDVSYVHSVYAPLSVRLAQHLVRPSGWRGIQDVLALLPGPTLEEGKGGPHEGYPKVVLVFFIGGCTFAEISALRFLSQQEDSMVEFVVATTKLINGNSFLKSLMEPLGPESPRTAK
ncbi:vacuolar protein sorting-associated protein 33A [Schistocerca serialis cubense]|uniref:vacuolar protein sorting-associated protein 33A n=1 Tax=Schistocerca cancellata TaxID=274614 RepID=UPI0021194B30|nr:vacuolar protein sorting-associated protein 33A [Schistocerca cancellata]XP_049839024.1 vacuolar protein sorting-associated protein 33A [Schistocerca gregaria]XP_049941874.1 vacuolar protein sorting-associated protein 33A [Schistocerca serialis cubense]